MTEMRVGSRIIHQHIESAKFLLNVIKQTIDSIRITDMTYEAACLAAVVPDGSCDGVDRLDLATGYYDVCTAIGQ